MKRLTARFALFLALISIITVAFTAEETAAQTASGTQVIKVNGSELTGLNASTVSFSLNEAKQRGGTAAVVDMGSVSRMTPAGMEVLTMGARSFGHDKFAVANLSGQPAELARSEGAGGFQVFPTLDEALAALRR